jgi:hypothetical protein
LQIWWGKEFLVNSAALRTKCGGSSLRQAQLQNGGFYIYRKSEILESGLGAERGVGNCGSAVVAEDCSWVDGVAAGVAVGCGDGGWSPSPKVCTWGSRDGVGSKDLAGDVHGLHDVVAANAAGHKEGFDPADDHGDAGPGEDEVEDAEAVAAEVEVMDAEAAEEDREEDAGDLVLAGSLVFGVEPGALLVVHVDGVDRVDGVHGVIPLE